MPFTVDQKIQIWNAVGTWVAGLGTFAAVGVALYLSRAGDRVNLEVHVGLRDRVHGDGTPAVPLVVFDVLNQSRVPVTIEAIGWKVGRGRTKVRAMQLVTSDSTADVPKTLEYGKRAFFAISLLEVPDWADQIAKGILSRDPKRLQKLLATVHPSVGGEIVVKPEPGLVKLLAAAIAKLSAEDSH